MINEASRKAFESFMRDRYQVRTLTRDGDPYAWAFAGELWAGWQAARKALETEQATECSSDEWLANCPQSVRDLANKIKQAQAVEPVVVVQKSAIFDGNTIVQYEGIEHLLVVGAELYLSPQNQLRQPLSTERAEAIARLFECLRITTLIPREATAIKDAADMLEADAQEIKELKALSVTNLLIDVVPGDGSSHEIYAKSVTDVERMLTKLASELEGAQSECHNLRDKLKAQQAAVPANKRGPRSVDKARLDWLDKNIFNRENLDLFGKLDQTYNMWVLFSPKSARGSARAIIDSAILAAAPQPPQGDKQ